MSLDMARAALQAYYNDLKTERAPWENMWRDTARYTLPASQFQNPDGKPGLALTESIYDGTSIHAANRLAAEILGTTINPNNRNFEFHPLDMRKLHDAKWKAFLQHLADSIQYMLFCPDYGFYTSSHEMLVEYVRFGQGQQLIERVGDRPRFLACPLSQCYTELDDERKVDSIVRSWRWTLRQLRSKFPPDKYNWPPDLLSKLNQPQQAGMRVEVCHAVVPSVDHPEVAGLAIFPKKYTHVIFFPQYKCHIIEVKGLDVFPFAVPRYLMMAEETYARGPGTLALPDTRMVNVMEKTNLKAVQKMADPPLFLPRRGWMRPIDVSPSALNYYDGMEEAKIQSFGIDGNPQLSAQFVDSHRQQIMQIYQLDTIMGNDKRAEMKEVEVLNDQEERLRAMAPQLARLYSEWFSKVIMLLLYYFNDELLAGYEGELPEELVQTGRLDLQLKYMSPLQRAQSMMDASNIKRVIDNFFIPVMQLDPHIGARFSSDGYTDWLVDAFNLPTTMILSKDQADQKIAEAKQKADAAQGASTAVDTTKAALQAAQAQAALPQQPPGAGVV